MDKDQQKEEYRQQAILHRDRRPVDQSDFERVIDIFFDNYSGENDKAISLYWPIKREFDTRYLMDELLQRGFMVALPVMQKDQREMLFKKWTHESEMKPNKFKIMEPQGADIVEPDIVIAPLLAFDQKGNRLGYGKGHYDATITALRAKKDVQYIGIGYDDQAVLFDLPTEEHDIPLDYLLTPKGVKEF